MGGAHGKQGDHGKERERGHEAPARILRRPPHVATDKPYGIGASVDDTVKGLDHVGRGAAKVVGAPLNLVHGAMVNPAGLSDATEEDARAAMNASAGDDATQG